jgi:hypothetical protein
LDEEFDICYRPEATQGFKWPKPSGHHFRLVVGILVEIWSSGKQLLSMFLILKVSKTCQCLYGLEMCSSITLLGWAWIDRAFATDRALKRKGRSVPKLFFSASPSESTLLSR